MLPSLRMYSIAGATVLAVGAAAYYAARKRRKSAEDHERERRERLNRIGRIIDGTVIDVLELPPTAARGKTPAGPSQLLVYQYDVAGVQYEASQDVTYLRQLIDLHSCRLGLPASVKYDAQNPGNSIVICEEWSGLHSGTRTVLGIQQMAMHEQKKAAVEAKPMSSDKVVSS
jgi:hypothetical protein